VGFVGQNAGVVGATGAGGAGGGGLGEAAAAIGLGARGAGAGQLVVGPGAVEVAFGSGNQAVGEVVLVAGDAVGGNVIGAQDLEDDAARVADVGGLAEVGVGDALRAAQAVAADAGEVAV